MSWKQIIKQRTDISSYLIHWTNQERFHAIIRSGFLIAGKAPRSSGDSLLEVYPTIYGSDQVVCWSETPIGDWLQSIEADIRYGNRKWGIALPKEVMYKYGARPVLYGDAQFLRRLQNEDKYLFCRFDYANADWMHEREWRSRPNHQFNNRIGLSNTAKIIHSHGQEHWVDGQNVIPIHLPLFENEYPLDEPPFVVIVENEEYKSRIIQPFPQPLLDKFTVQYSQIQDYWNKYLHAYSKAKIISLEQVRQHQNARGSCRLEDLL